jgi:peptide/nickel transport system ATP-binding protein
MNSAVLRVQHLSLSIGDQPILKGVDFRLAPGEIFALVGESGSGKSMTSLAIMRLLPAGSQIHSGDVLLAERSLLGLTEHEMTQVRGRRIAMIFQEPQTSLNPVMRVGQQIGEALERHLGLSRAQARLKAQHLLEEVGIDEAKARLDYYPHQLSGGQKQRVMIAMALACEPEVLIADEPTTALDVTIQAQILQLLKKLRDERGLSILLITHDLGVVAQMADRLGVMVRGALVETSTTQAFFAGPKNDYSQQLLAAAPKQGTFLPALTRQEPLLSVRDMTVNYTGFQALKPTQLTLARGETLAIVGESGSGKTTLGRAILQLIREATGDVQLHNEPVVSLMRHRVGVQKFRRACQIIFQDPFSSMNPRMPVGEIIREGMVSLGVIEQRAEQEARIAQLMTQVGLNPEWIHRYPHEFSGGQRQRIAIARALAVEPELIVCDEPTSALDLSIRGQIIELLRDLQQRKGLSYLFITHDLSLVPHIAHRVMVMRQGEVVETGPCESVLTAPQMQYTRDLLAAIPRVPGAV